MMRTLHLLNKNSNVLVRICRRHLASAKAGPIQVNHALVLSKFTRYEVEKSCHPELTESELKKFLKSRGSNYESLLDHHQRHKDYEKYVLDSFKEMDITTKLLTRLDYTDSWIDWADVVFPVGGDGTFLLAASRVTDNRKPVVGFNSDPNHSEGFLCLNRNSTENTRMMSKEVLNRLKQGSFNWLFRTRIRVSLTSKDVEPQEMVHDKKLLGSHRTEPLWCSKKKMSSLTPTLNEVFIGESMSAQVSYFEMKLPPREDTFRVKSSGLCVSTGTGSTSWHLSMNRVTDEGVAHVLKCAGLTPTPSECQAIAKKYNDSLLFDPEQMEMCYTIRDLINAGVWPSPPGLSPRGFAQTLWVRSRCRDARLVIDGGSSFLFNDGSEVLFDLHPEDALRTVLL
ncbi:NAD kinase 2, mitochondrial [Macrosteles quadrilineatus]|uniref:NAD kinase 2, mitochondrial n=1 Tax=Macrosteles quadrilineatus TaxID=74068 RepID=UPI0023E263B3|nr:NAD kinase 2, mitochondrial [Macrosteles quadrilineatus]